MRPRALRMSEAALHCQDRPQTWSIGAVAAYRACARRFAASGRTPGARSSQSRCATLSPAVHNSSADAMSVPGGGDLWLRSRACAAGSAASASAPSRLRRASHPSTCLRAQGPRRACLPPSDRGQVNATTASPPSCPSWWAWRRRLRPPPYLSRPNPLPLLPRTVCPRLRRLPCT